VILQRSLILAPAKAGSDFFLLLDPSAKALGYGKMKWGCRANFVPHPDRLPKGEGKTEDP
jgi:hypothetical protein